MNRLDVAVPGHKHVDHGVPIDAVPTNAKCSGVHNDRLAAPCPRHNPTVYAKYYARRASDGIYR